jgi:signal transduction histidine kinase
MMLPTLYLLITTILFPLFSNTHEAVKYNLWLGIVTFFVFLILSIRYGVMGCKVTLEKMNLDMTMRAVSSGTMILSHALKNELTNIAIYSECLNNNDPVVNSIQKSSERMLKIIQRMNDELKHINISKKAGNLNELIEELLNSLKVHLKKKNISVVKDLKNNLILEYDQIYFREALLNIVKNAIEAMDTGGILNISVKTIGKYALIKITDTGVGISKENLPYIFDPFFSTKQNIEENYGLGLSSSYRIIQQHGGTLEIISKENKGTTVLIRIPKLRN